MKRTLAQLAAFGLLPLLTTGCGGGDGASRCGPSRATVTRVIDGDTVELEDGTKVRYLLIDTPEISGGAECYGPEARDFNAALVEGREVSLRYDVECTDHYGRLLAYVYVESTEVNMRMVEYGFACVLVIPPNGADRELEFKTAEAEAKADQRGMWDPDVCQEVACDD